MSTSAERLFTCLPGSIGRSGNKTHWILVEIKDNYKTYRAACQRYVAKNHQIESPVSSLSYSPVEITCSRCQQLNPLSTFEENVINILKATGRRNKR